MKELSLNSLISPDKKIIFFDNFLPGVEKCGITTNEFGDGNYYSHPMKNQGRLAMGRIKRLVRNLEANSYFIPHPKGEDKITEFIPTEGRFARAPVDAIIYKNNLYIDAYPAIIFPTGDCPIIMISDGNVFCVVHSGLNGTYKNIVKKTIDLALKIFGIDIKKTKAIVWPGISQENYEVGPEWLEIFPDYISNSKLDLSGVIKNQLIDSGMKNKSIGVIDKFCTYRDKDLFFSHRRKQWKRNLTFLKIQKNPRK